MNIDFFKEFRKNLNMKQKEFAALLGVSEDYVSKIERGKRKISDEIEKKINKIIEDGEKPKATTLEEVCKEADEANKKGFSKELRYYGQMYLDRQRQIELAKKSQKSIIEMAKNKGITKEMIVSYCSVIQLEDFNKNVLFAAVDSEGEYFFEE